MNPQARKERLVIEELPEETLIYDETLFSCLGVQVPLRVTLLALIGRFEPVGLPGGAKATRWSIGCKNIVDYR